MPATDPIDDRLDEVWHLEAQGASEDARGLLDRLAAENPRDPRVHVTVGSYYVYSRKGLARRALRRATEIAPGCLEAYVHLAASHQVGGQRRWALEYARRGRAAAHRHWDDVSTRDYAELLFEEAEALASAGDRAGVLRGLRSGLVRLEKSPRVAEAIANVELVRARGALAAPTLRDALDHARFQVHRGRPLRHDLSGTAPIVGAHRIVHAGWGRARPPLLCFADHGENLVRTFCCWTCGASHGESALGQGAIELHVNHAGPWLDLLDGGTLVSARVVDALERAGVGGFRAFPIDLLVKGRPDMRRAYRWLDVPVTATCEGPADRCEECGALLPRGRAGRLVGRGEGLFRSAWDREAICASPQVVALARARRWTGFRFARV